MMHMVPALFAFFLVTTLVPLCADAYIGRGITHSLKREYDRAIADYDRGIQLDPKDAENFLQRGRTYCDMGEHEKALADFTEALRLNASNVYAYALRGYL